VYSNQDSFSIVHPESRNAVYLSQAHYGISLTVDIAITHMEDRPTSWVTVDNESTRRKGFVLFCQTLLSPKIERAQARSKREQMREEAKAS
jgi:hypothetical protein